MVFYQYQHVSRSTCDAAQPQLGSFFACFYELKCSSPRTRPPGDPRAFIIYSDSLPAPAPQIIPHLVTATMAILQPAASVTVNLQSALALLLPPPCDGLENGTTIPFRAEGARDPMSAAALSLRRAGSAGSVSSVSRGRCWGSEPCGLCCPSRFSSLCFNCELSFCCFTFRVSEGSFVSKGIPGAWEWRSSPSTPGVSPQSVPRCVPSRDVLLFYVPHGAGG